MTADQGYPQARLKIGIHPSQKCFSASLDMRRILVNGLVVNLSREKMRDGTETNLGGYDLK